MDLCPGPAARKPPAPDAPTAAPRPVARLSRRAATARSSSIRDLLRHASRPGMLSMAGGLPAPETFAVGAVADALAGVLADHGASALQYSSTEGLPELREWIAGRHLADGGVPRDAGSVVVTSGSQQALDLAGRVLLDPGDVVVIDDPAYLGAVMALGAHDPRLVGIPVDADGMCTDVLADRLARGLRPRLCYTNASFHNPTGATLSDERRRHLAGLADHFGFVVVEDDPYGDLWFDAPPPPPVAAHGELVLRLGSASKVVAPGLRVGWAVGPAPIVAAMVVAKQAVDLQAGTLSQMALHRLLADGPWLAAQLDGLRAGYAARSRALVAALHRLLGDRVEVGTPRGGMFVWPRLLPDGGDTADILDTVDTTALLARALDRGVAFVPGRAFAVDRPADDRARLSFATVAVDRFDDAVGRLREALDDVSAVASPR